MTDLDRARSLRWPTQETREELDSAAASPAADLRGQAGRTASKPWKRRFTLQDILFELHEWQWHCIERVRDWC